MDYTTFGPIVLHLQHGGLLVFIVVIVDIEVQVYGIGVVGCESQDTKNKSKHNRAILTSKTGVDTGGSASAPDFLCWYLATMACRLGR
jgi:hypothetical protein